MRPSYSTSSHPRAIDSVVSMHRLAAPLLVLSLTGVACGGNDGGNDAGAAATDATSSVAPTTTEPPTSTEPPPTTMSRPTIPVPAVSDVEGILALDRPVVLGHAGGDQSWPTSTMYAFVQAAVAGVDVLEMDVQLTGDGVLVVQHDDTVDRTTEATGRVRDLTYDELQELDNGYWWSDQWSSRDLPDEAYLYRGIRTGEVDPPDGFSADDFRVETFRAIAEAFPDHVLDVEIKIPAGDHGENDLDFAIEGALALAEEVIALDRTDSVVVVSFDDDVMAAFRDAAPGVVTSPGRAAMYGWIVGAELTDTDLVLQLPPFFGDVEILTDQVLAKAAAEGLAIWAWPDDAGTQENADFYQELIERGVDGIIAGRPAEAVERFAAMAAGP